MFGFLLLSIVSARRFNRAQLLDEKNCEVHSFEFHTSGLQFNEMKGCLTFSNSIVINCTGNENGGALYVKSPQLEVHVLRSSFLNCEAEKVGGGIYAVADASEILGCCFLECVAADCAAIYAVTSELNENSICQVSVIRCVSSASEMIHIESGQQNINSLNSSLNTVAKGGSSVSVVANGAAGVDLSHFESNVGEYTLNLKVSGKETSVMLSNFINNTNTAGYIISTSGMWTIRRSVFLRNIGHEFQSVEDSLFIRMSFMDKKPEKADPKVEFGQDVTYGTETATYAITDIHHGNCPAEGTPLTAMPSPTPAATVETPSQSSFIPPPSESPTEVVTPTASRSHVAMPENNAGKAMGMLFLVLISIIIVIIVCMKICTKVGEGQGFSNIEHMTDDFIVPIEIQDEIESEYDEDSEYEEDTDDV